MKRQMALRALGLIVAIALAAACAPAPAPGPAPIAPTATVAAVQASSSTADPFAYCATVGTVDAPDARWTGPKEPDAVVQGLRKAMGIPAGAPAGPAGSNLWRCMNGQVYACNVGANIPCSEKADTNRTPTAEMNDFCKANTSADFIPAAVTGRATVYSWKCVNGMATVDKQLTQPDARGFLSSFWYEIPKKRLPASLRFWLPN